MEAVTLQTLAEACGGKLVQGDEALEVTTICKDTRTLRAGDIYWALSGENHNGHDFVLSAAKTGASVAVVSEEVNGVPENFAMVRVPDTLKALHRLAAWYRGRLRAKVIVLTGSNGKTSTKDFTAGVVGAHYRASKTEGNLNNHIGLPLTMLGASLDDEVVVWEIGMNHPGEIAELAALARPDIGIITNIGMAHIEFMGSREAIAKEKGMLGEALEADGILILPARDEFATELATRTDGRVVLVGEVDGLHAENVHLGREGQEIDIVLGEERVAARIGVAGEHMVGNALLAVAAGVELGMSLEECAEGLSSAQLSKGRLACREVRGVIVLDDTYNANPDSMEAALRTVKALQNSGRKMAVLGKMGELGSHEEEGYRRTGRIAAETVDILFVVGKEAAAIADEAKEAGLVDVRCVEDTKEAGKVLSETARPGDAVVVKGSRSARMEQVIEEFV